MDREGVVATNFHVIAGATKVTVIFQSSESVDATGFCHVNPAHDLALLSLPSIPVGTPVLRLNSDMPRKGQDVLAFGSPKGIVWTASPGMVSAVRAGAAVRHTFPELYGRDSDLIDDSSTWIQHSAPISHGSSGGPLTNEKGEVVGVNTLGHPKGQNLNFAVAAKHVSEAITARERIPRPFTSLPTRRVAEDRVPAPEGL